MSMTQVCLEHRDPLIRRSSFAAWILDSKSTANGSTKVKLYPLMDLVASSSNPRTASGYYSNLLGMQASYNDSRNNLPQIFGQHNVFLWGLGAHFLAFYWCDGPVERLSVPESLDIFSRVGSTQRSTLSGDECPHPQTSTPLWALQPP
jgi:hypothetical protein